MNNDDLQFMNENAKRSKIPPTQKRGMVGMNP